MGLKQALTEACKVRLRPILMTTMATILVSSPWPCALEPGSEQYPHWPVAILGGLTVSGIVHSLFGANRLSADAPQRRASTNGWRGSIMKSISESTSPPSHYFNKPRVTCSKPLANATQRPQAQSLSRRRRTIANCRNVCTVRRVPGSSDPAHPPGCGKNCVGEQPSHPTSSVDFKSAASGRSRTSC